MKELLLSEKWRPKTIPDIILPERIVGKFQNGITQNLLFYGHYGTGKTSLARILIGKYSKDKAYLEINSSFYTSIDVLRSKVDDFCSKVYMGFDLEASITKDSMKYVFLDEFERTSPQYQDALKAYIEEYSAKNVRFIFNTNHINKISNGIKSRLTAIDFNCENSEEERDLKRKIYNRISKIILPGEKIDTISKESLIKIINSNFPDFRSTLNELQSFIETGSLNKIDNVNEKLKIELFQILYDKSKTYEELYHFLMNKFGPDNMDVMINILGRSFIQWVFSEKKEDINKLFQVNYIISDNFKLLETNTDPIIVGLTVIGKIRDILIQD